MGEIRPAKEEDAQEKILANAQDLEKIAHDIRENLQRYFERRAISNKQEGEARPDKSNILDSVIESQLITREELFEIHRIFSECIIAKI